MSVTTGVKWGDLWTHQRFYVRTTDVYWCVTLKSECQYRVADWSDVVPNLYRGHPVECSWILLSVKVYDWNPTSWMICILGSVLLRNRLITRTVSCIGKSPFQVDNAVSSWKFDLSDWVVEYDSRPLLRRWFTGGTTSEVLDFVFPCLSSADQRCLIITVKFLPDPIVRVSDVCEIMYLNRILNSRQDPSSARLFHLFWKQDMKISLIDDIAWEDFVVMFASHFASLWTGAILMSEIVFFLV